MRKKMLLVVLIALFLVGCGQGPGTPAQGGENVGEDKSAETNSQDANLEKIKLLEEKIVELEAQIAELEGQLASGEEVVRELPQYVDYYGPDKQFHFEAAYYLIKDNLFSYWNRDILEEFIANDIYNVFHPLFLHEGDKILSCQVSKIEESDRHRSVEFSGEITTKLIVSKDKYYDGEYSFELAKDYYDKVPIDIFTYCKNKDSDYPMFYRLSEESQEKLLKAIGEAYYDGIEVMVKLDKYKMIYDQSNFANWIEFVELVSIEGKNTKP